MKREEYTINLKYAFNPEHKGAPYTLDGIHYMNGGDFAEIVTKSVLGYKAEKDGNTPFDKGSDIEEIQTSVKSSKATLTSTVLGNDYDTIKTEYFKRVHSTAWIYTVLIDDKAILYRMNKEEFSLFMDCFSSYASDRKVIRFKSTSGKMITWLDKHCACQACHAVNEDKGTDDDKGTQVDKGTVRQ